MAILFGFTSKAQSLTANFSASPTAGCSPLVVNFKDLSTGNVTGWQWDFGNGGTSTLKNPSAIYFTPGNYTVTLTVTDATNATNTTVKTAFITIYAQPAVDFSVDKRTGCSPAKIKFTDKSATPAGTVITSWKWDFGDGGSSTQQNPSYTYRTPGSYTVTLSITNDKGCTQLITKPNYIDITQGVVPSFSYVDPAVCSAPATVNFTNKSTGPGTLSYKWNFGNGKTAATFNASTVYATNGTYRISLIVSSNLGCTDSTASSLDIGKVTTDFIIPASICPKVPVQFLNNATPRPIKAFWKFSNGTTDTLKNGLTTFAAPGNYTVTLINTYAVCTDTLIKNITVVAAPTLDFKASDTAKCQPSLTTNFSNTSNGTTYFWDFGDSTSSTQTSPVHTYNKFGDYTVTLIATGTNGCSDTLKKPAYIKIRKPVISLPGLPTQGCIPFKMNFKANIQSVDTITSYKWDFGDGSGTSTLAQPTYIYPNKGTYTVTLTITTSSGCTETKIVKDAVKVGPKPFPDFSADVTTACADPGIQFTNLSTGATEYTWDFGDGTTSNEVNPKHVFSDIGSLDITLTAINNGCQDMISKSDFVFIKPSVSRFDYKPNCNNRLQYTFTDKSLSATSWNWDFGDGTTFVGQSPPVHTFPSLGTYNITLTTTNGGCSYSLTRTIKIADLTPNFTSSTRAGCKPFTPIINPVLPNSKLITNYVWDFGDGSGLKDFGPGNNGQFTYPDAGTYNVTLITIDTFGCSHQLTKNTFINVYGPTADFTSTNNAGCKGLTTTFIDSSKTDGSHPIQSWKWNFGDSTFQTYTAPPFQHTYDSVGDFDIKLVVTDSKGCSDSILNREFVKISAIKAKWQTTGLTCPNSYLGFFNQTISDLPYTSLWNFGDGDTSTARELSHKYADTGLYSVSLVVQDLLGCKDSLTKDSIKVGLPQADFTANNFITYCTPFEAKFLNTSTYYESSNWDLSQATSNQKNPSLYYTTAGVYPIKLIVTSPGGCKDTVTIAYRTQCQ
jgi:PKD repeat protein